jgi:(E)-4-hydroxy-3-methylbut-2-enyl-diphosphate synthase
LRLWNIIYQLAYPTSSLYNLVHMVKRRVSKKIFVGSVSVGGDAPIRVQSMTKTDTRDARATIRQIKELQECGCEIIRCAVPDLQAAQSLREIKKGIGIPLVADIHFDYRLALAALEAGVDGLRLNPGNISDPSKVTAVVKAARERRTPIRIGVNFGSLPRDLDPALSLPQKMAEAALRQIRLLESLDFELIKISLKAFDLPTTVDAYREIAAKIPYPLHIGITESGTVRSGTIRSAAGIAILLWEGLGDTLRVSLTSQPHEEVYTGWEILKGLNLRERGAKLVSCPTCGRTEVDIVNLAGEVERQLAGFDKTIKVAVMGCIVNGPGEAADADIGVACGKGKGVIFSQGVQLRTVDERDILSELMKEIEKL